MERHAKMKIGFLVLLITVLGIAAVLVAGQAGPNESAGYTIDGDSAYWEIPGKGRITVSPHTSHGSWDTMRYQNIEFESYLGTDEVIVIIVKTIAVLLTFIILAVCLTIYGVKRRSP